jgi:hypothetical protein
MDVRVEDRKVGRGNMGSEQRQGEGEGQGVGVHARIFMV